MLIGVADKRGALSASQRAVSLAAAFRAKQKRRLRLAGRSAQTGWRGWVSSASTISVESGSGSTAELVSGRLPTGVAGHRRRKPRSGVGSSGLGGRPGGGCSRL